MAKGAMTDTLISTEEHLYAIPDNWHWVRQGKVSRFINGRAYKQEELLDDVTQTPILRVGNLFTNGSWYYSDLQLDADKYIDNEDLIYAWSASFGPFIWYGGKVIYHYHIWKIVISKYVNKKYYYFWLLEDVERLKRVGHGTGMMHVTKDMMERAIMPLPPISEQKRIVDRIESLFAKLDEAKEKAQAVVDGYEDRKAAILHQAFTGELTAKWRSDNTIDRNSWQTVSVKEVCHDVKVGIVIKPSQYYTDRSKGTPAFRSANVREFHVDDFDWVYLNEEGMKENQRSIVHTGDVLVVRSGNPGTACVVEEKYNGYNAIDILIAVPDKNRITSEYLCAFTNSPLGRKLVAENKRGMALTHFNVSGYSALVLELPSIQEQKEIVRIMHEMLKKEGTSKDAAEQVIAQIDTMKKAILARAFRGELGTNDPTESPADIGIS